MPSYPEEFAIWLWEHKFFQSTEFRAENGQTIRLIYRGSRNYDAGPDFKNVTIEIDSKIQSGNLEIHINASDWYTHGHHEDPAYNKVLLHAVLNSNNSESQSQLENGLNVPIVNLAALLKESPDRLYQKYLQIRQLPQSACAISKLPFDEIHTKLDRAGAARLTLKGLAFRELRMFNSWDQILYLGIMEALGYSKNREAFRKLATYLPIEFIFREMRATPPADAEIKIQGLLFGAAGLLPAQQVRPQEIVNSTVRSFTFSLERIWDDFRHRIGIRPMQSTEWKFFRLRPQNFPTRRLAGMCSLLLGLYETGIYNSCLKIFSGLPDDFETINNELEKLFICPATGFWKDHYQFNEATSTHWQRKFPNLIGADRAKDIVINVLFPVFLLSAHERNDGRLEAAVKETYRRFPLLADNTIVREMVKKIFPDSRNRHKINNAQKQQGVIYLSKNFCNENKCQDCLTF